MEHGVRSGNIPKRDERQRGRNGASIRSINKGRDYSQNLSNYAAEDWKRLRQDLIAVYNSKPS